MRGGSVTGALVGLLLLTGCSGADPALVEDLEATGLTLYAPEVRGTSPSGVRVDTGSVVLSYDDDGFRFSVDLDPVAGGPLCESVSYESGSECTETDGVMVATFEEMSVVAVQRDGAVLVARGIVTEADPDLAGDVGAALQDAPEASAEELAESVA